MYITNGNTIRVHTYIVHINFLTQKNTDHVTDQSNPAAKLFSIAGDMSLAAFMMHLSA